VVYFNLNYLPDWLMDLLGEFQNIDNLNLIFKF